MGHTFKADNIPILTAFGDIADFSTWAKRSTTNPEDFKKFIIYCHNRFTQLRKQKYYVKLFSDGVMIIHELSDKNQAAQIVSFINECFSLCSDIKKSIDSLDYPKPSGFRIRLAKGYAWKLQSDDKKDIDYIGYIINMVFRFLSLKKEITMIGHESIRIIHKLIPKRKCPFKFSQIIPIGQEFPGVDKEDVDDLWKITKKR